MIEVSRPKLSLRVIELHHDDNHDAAVGAIFEKGSSEDKYKDRIKRQLIRISSLSLSMKTRINMWWSVYVHIIYIR